MYDLLIIGPQAWVDSLEWFCQYKQDTGIRSKVVTREDAEERLGPSVPDHRSAASKENIAAVNGITQVLLVGDADQFPVRYVKATNTEWGVIWYASDLYYADLYDANGAFDDWDADGDGIYAEMDFEQVGNGAKFNIDKINLRVDVVVGRIPASTREEAERYFKKVLAYEYSAQKSQAYGYATGLVQVPCLRPGLASAASPISTLSRSTKPASGSRVAMRTTSTGRKPRPSGATAPRIAQVARQRCGLPALSWAWQYQRVRRLVLDTGRGGAGQREPSPDRPCHVLPYRQIPHRQEQLPDRNGGRLDRQRGIRRRPATTGSLAGEARQGLYGRRVFGASYWRCHCIHRGYPHIRAWWEGARRVLP